MSNTAASKRTDSNPAKPKATGSKSSGPATLSLILLLAVGSSLALQTTIAKVAAGVGTPLLSFLSLAILGAGALLLIRAPKPRLSLGLLAYTAVSGALFALPNALGFLAVAELGAGFVAIIFAFVPLLTWALAVLIGMERALKQRAFGVLLALSGAIALSLSKLQGDGAGGTWVLITLSFPLMLATGNLFRSRFWPQGVSPVFLAGSMLFAGGLFVAPFALIVEGVSLAQIPAALPLLGAETLIFALSFFLYFQLQSRAGAVYLSQIGPVIALMGAVIAVLALGESLPQMVWPAGALIAIGTLTFHRARVPSA